ncbi:hypothetical protein C8R44DRAFT_804744, partial [Mycena epipterygia]
MQMAWTLSEKILIGLQPLPIAFFFFLRSVGVRCGEGRVDALVILSPGLPVVGHPRPLVGGHGLGTRPDINSTLSRKCVDRIRAYSTICGAAVSSLAQ